VPLDDALLVIMAARSISFRRFTPVSTAGHAEATKVLHFLTLEACPSANLPMKRQSITVKEVAELRWVQSRVVLQGEFPECAPGGLLRHSQFQAIKGDKAAKDVRRE
jgi:hypothetical protein